MGLGRNIKTMEQELVRRQHISMAHKGKKKSDKWKEARKKFRLTKKSKGKIKQSLKKYYDNEINKNKLLGNLDKARNSRTDESFKEGAKKRLINLKEGFGRTRKGQKNSIEHRQKIADANKIALKFFYDNHPLVKIEKSYIMKEKWKNKEYATKMIKLLRKSLQNRPSSFEKKIILLCSKYNLPFVYTGDGRILIGLKNPDFVNEKDKVVIEVFLNYFKIRDYGSIENYIKIREEHFSQYGYKTIFIQENEIMDENWENICLNKISEVLK